MLEYTGIEATFKLANYWQNIHINKRNVILNDSIRLKLLSIFCDAYMIAYKNILKQEDFYRNKKDYSDETWGKIYKQQDDLFENIKYNIEFLMKY